MKKVKLIHIYQQDKNYSVSLGNGTAQTFTSKTAALAYLAQTNQALTAQLYELRDIHTTIQTLYSQNWGLFRHDKKTFGYERATSERITLAALQSNETQFNLIADRSSHTNGNYLTFTHFRAITENLKIALKELQTLYRANSNTPSLYRCDSLFNRIFTVENFLTHYGQAEATEFIKVPAHIDYTKQYNPKLKTA